MILGRVGCEVGTSGTAEFGERRVDGAYGSGRNVMGECEEAVRRLLDKSAIQDTMCRYARGCDRGDWDLVRATYHPDAVDDHVDYCGGVDGLIAWLEDRFAGVDNSVHFLGNCLVEPAGEDVALVETYFVSSRLVASSSGTNADRGSCRQSWGRYVDRFERREGEWRVARRKVLLEASFTTPVHGRPRTSEDWWSRRDGDDYLWRERTALRIGLG